MEIKKLESLLEQYGLSNYEVKIYIGLLKFGPSTIMELSNRIRMNRSTTHVNVESLIKKGLLSQTNYGERRMIIPEEPEKLQILLEEERIELKRKENNLPGLISNIYDIVANAKTSSESVVKYYRGKKAVSLIYDSALNSKYIRGYYDWELLSKYFPENDTKFFEAVKNKNLLVDDIIAGAPPRDLVANDAIYNNIANVRYKYFPQDVELAIIDQMIFDNSISMMYMEDVPCAVVIENPLLANNSKILFDLMWRLLPDSIS